MNKPKEHSELIKAGIIFFIFAGVVAVFNYLYHLSMIRMLGPEDYGILGSLFAIIYLVTFSTSPINLVISKITAQYHLKDKEKIKYIYYNSFKKIIFIGLIGLFIYILLSPFIGAYMNITDIPGIILVGVIAYFSLIAVLLTGTLNGMQKFVWQNSSGLVSTFLKFALAVIFVWLGFKVNGALAAIIIGILISICVAYIPIKREFKKLGQKKVDLKPMYYYGIPVFISSILFILIITIDQILVKHFFSSTDAGIYAAAGMIAKVVWFGSSFLIGPLFPKVVALKSKNKDTSQLLTKSLIYVSILATLGCVVLFIAPNFIVRILSGHLYDNAVPLIGMLGVSLGIFSLLQIFMTYNLAAEKFKFIYIFVIGVLIEIVGIYLFHSSLMDIVKIVLITNIFLLISFLLFNKKEILGKSNFQFLDLLGIRKYVMFIVR